MFAERRMRKLEKKLNEVEERKITVVGLMEAMEEPDKDDENPSVDGNTPSVDP